MEQHSSISIADALGVLLYNTFSRWFNSQESCLQKWFDNNSRELQSHRWISFPNTLMGEHEMVIHNHGKLCTTVSVTVIVTIHKVDKSYVWANKAQVGITNSYGWEI